jgi:hypothetical protein
MHKNAIKCNETLSKWCKNKHGASKIIDTLETYQCYLHGDQGGAAWHLLFTMMSLDGMVQWGLDDERGMMDARRVVALSSIVVASMAGLARSMH